MEYYRDHTGLLSKLPSQNVDTGMGFERICMVLQNKTSPYDTDIFEGVFDIVFKKKAKRLDPTKKEENRKELTEGSAIRIFADHIRTTILLIANGVIPSNV